MKSFKIMLIGSLLIFGGLLSQPVWAEKPELQFDQLLEQYSQEEEILGWLEEYFAEGHQFLLDLKKEDRDAYEEELFSYGERVAELEEARGYSKEYFALALEGDKLELQSWKLAESYFEEDLSEAKEKIASELENVLLSIFELRLKEKKMEIQEIEKELNELKSIVDRRENKRDAIIEKRLQELLQSDDDLGWW